MAAREGGRFPAAADPKPRWSPAGRAQPCRRGAVPLRGQERGKSTAERARASGSAIREARGRSRGSSRSEHDAATERARSGGVAGLPQTSPNVTRVTPPARRSGDAERRADIGDAERATSRERAVESTEHRRPCRACAGRMRRSCAPCRVRRRASSDVCASSDVASPARLWQSRHQRRRAQSRRRRPSERRAASELSSGPSAADLVVRAPVVRRAVTVSL